MKRQFKTILLVSLLFALATNSSAQYDEIKAFSQSMKEFTSLGHFPFHKEDDWDFLDLKRVDWKWSERLQAKATPDSDGVLKSALVILIARRYESTEDALDALSNVRNAGPEGKYLIFDYSLVKEDTLFSLWGACYFDRQTWDSIKRKLVFAVLGEGQVPNNSVSIPCESKRSEPGKLSDN